MRAFVKRASGLAMSALLGLGTVAVTATTAAPASAHPSHSRDAAETQDVNWDNFEKKKLTDDVGEPMDMAVLPDSRVLMTDRRGTVRLFDPKTYNTTKAGKIDVYTGSEDGLQGIEIDPNFEQNHWVYTYYAPKGTEPKNVLARFKLDGNKLDISSKQVVLEVPTQRVLCCHVGGDINFGPKGNLYLSTGDNTNPWESSGYAPIDERKGRKYYDAQRTSANTNDLRGKILRIHVEKDGSYTVPKGNLFPESEDKNEKTRPEIYYMGLRNPFRFEVDPKTGWLYIGNVGPDASEDNPKRGPRQYEELDVVTKPGNGGWPYCVGNDFAYRDYNFATKESGPKFDCNNLVNDSPNNTGLKKLPPAHNPQIWYPYDCYDKFPQIDCPGGGTAMGGPVYRYDPDLKSNTKFPKKFDGVQFFYEYSRGFVKQVRYDDKANLKSIKPFLPKTEFNQPMDMEFGPKGSLYVIEYGGGFFTPGPDAGIYRIDYTGGEHSPNAKLATDPTSGDAPLEVSFDASASTDEDGDKITYAWDFDGDGKDDASGPTATHTYAEEGTYDAKLTVTDSTGRFTVNRVTISVGNTAPEVKLEFPANGNMFEWGDKVSYRVSVTDAEDGTIGNGIDCEDVSVQMALGHDVHAHPQSSTEGCEGVIQTQKGEGHSSSADLFTVLRANYTDEGSGDVKPIDGSHEIVLEPKHKQVEHFEQQKGVKVAAAEKAQGKKVVSDIDPGDWVAYSPASLNMIDDVSFRVSSNGPGGKIQLRQGSPDGKVLGTATVSGTGGTGKYVELDPVKVTDPGGTHKLYLVFTGSGKNLFRVDSMHFQGLGAAGPVNVNVESDVSRGPAPLKVNFDSAAPRAPKNATYAWDFGDGTTGKGAEASHTYSEPGEYTATLKVTDENGVTRGTATTTVRVSEKINGSVTLTPEQATKPARADRQLSATFTPQGGAPAGDQPITFEVFRKSPASGLPEGHDKGTPYVLAERKVVKTSNDGAASMSYTSTVAADDIVLACLGYAGSCVRGGDTLVVGPDGQKRNVRDDLIVDSATTTWKAAPDNKGWTTLFDGRSLAGWRHVGKGGFAVDNGTMTARGDRGILWYAQRQYKDFTLKLQYQNHGVSDNSGIYLRFPDPKDDLGVPGKKGYEVAILDRTSNPEDRTGAISGINRAESFTYKALGTGYNTVRIEATGHKYQIFWNGTKVNTFTGKRNLKGYIGIENDTPGVDFRNIRIKASGTTAPPASAASTEPGTPKPSGDSRGRDSCPGSDTRETVVIDGNDSRVANADIGAGCTISDRIHVSGTYDSHGAFVNHVGRVTSDLVEAGHLDGRQRGKIVQAAARSDIGNPTELLDGKDPLAGWRQAGPGHFEVLDSGVIEGRGGMGLLWYEKQKFEEYVLHLDFRLTDKSNNSGVFVGSPKPGNDPWVAVDHGEEIQINDNPGGDPQKTGAIYNEKPATARASKPIGEWNHYTITVRGGAITVELNGKQVNHWVDDDPKVDLSEGFIGLQNHPPTPVQFRDVRINELGQ